MARTQTQKALRKAKRAGNYCSAQSRKTNGHYGEISQHVRMKPTKQEQLQRIKHKKRIVQSDASFLFSIIYLSFIVKKGLDNNYHSC
ncbi:hypothetical protein C1I60_23630 [Paenibacillus terrae]|uniref:Yqkk n=1 Tax=Paenibacillus terrae TaxID=159743 RepID=A0A4U2PRV1_9BACL|nr:hypothetical protein [Paenibacillus terrae]TKH40766.1 hypothetical protein C1I60_23630 [Paenibacillus terrae]